MADSQIFKSLQRLFSSDILVRNVGGDQLKIADVNHIQSTGRYQTNSLYDRFTKLYVYNNKNIFNPTLNYQTLRVQLYSDYEAMDTDPIIASCLDILADEASLRNDMGEILSIKSSDENVQKILYNLYYDVLNIEFNLWAWVRNTCKYGDFFLKLEIAEEFGVYNVIPYTVYHMSRMEGQDPENPTKVQFIITPDGLASATDPNFLNKNNTNQVVLDNYEVAHFRLLSDVSYLPYGRSYIEPARKVYKQLCLPKGTKIWTVDGYRVIEDIRPGDSIYSYDYSTDSTIVTTVKNQIKTGEKEVYRIVTGHRTLEATGEHPVMVSGGTYKRVDELTENDYLVLGNTGLVDYNFSVNLKLDDNNVAVERIEVIEKLEGVREVYDIEVDHDLHNFIAEGVIAHNCLMEDAMLIHRIMRAPEKRMFYINVGTVPPNEIDQFMQKTISSIKKTPYIDPQTGQYNLRFNMQNMTEDFFLPVRGGDTSTRIETAKGLDYDGKADVEYMRDKMFAALKVPKAFFGYDKDLSGRSTLAAEDIRFSRTVERIQRIFESELTKIGLVHLYAQGYKDETLTNFEIKLTTPSIIYEQEKIALLKEKVDLARQMQETKLFSSDYIYDNLFNFSEDMYMEMRSLVVEDAKRSFRVEQIENEGNDPMVTGKSYGTPHDLASLYGSKQDERPDLTSSPVKLGRPITKHSMLGTQADPLGGVDRLGVKGMKGKYPTDADRIRESIQLNTFTKRKLGEEVDLEIETETSNILNESNLREDLQ